MPEQDNLEFRKKTYKNLKTAFGDDYTLTEEQFNKNMDSDTAFVTKTYKNLKTAFGDDYSIVEEDFKKKVLPISGSPTTSASSNGSNPTQPTSGSGDSRGRNPKISFLADIVTELNPDAPKLKEGQSVDDWGKELTTFAKQYPMPKEGEPWKKEDSITRMRYKLAQKNQNFEEFVDERLPQVEGMTERDKNLFLYKEYLKENNPTALKKYEESRAYKTDAPGVAAKLLLDTSPEDTERIDAEFYDKALEMSQNYLNIKYKKLNELTATPQFKELMSVNQSAAQEMDALNKSYESGNIDRANYESNAAAIKQRYDQSWAELAPVMETANKLQSEAQKNLIEASTWINRFPAEAKRRMEEKAQDDFDEAMYALTPSRKMAANFTNQIGRGVTEFIANTFSLPQVFSQDSEYGWSDRLADVSQEWASAVNKDLFPVPKKMEKGIVNTDYSVNWDLVLPKTTRTLTDMGIMASTGSASGTVATSFVMNAKSYYDEALAQRMNTQDASKFAVSMAMQQSLLELVNPEYALIKRGLTKMATKDATRMLSEGVSLPDAIKATAKAMGKNMVMESTQEQLQLFGDMTGKMAANIITGSDFEFDDIGQQVTESLLLTSIVSALGGGGIGATQNSRSELEKRAIYTAVDTPELLLQATNKAVEAGQLDPVAAQRINLTVGELKQNLDALPSNVKETERSEVVNALFDKSKLVQIASNEALNPAIKAVYENKIKEIDDAVGKIISKYVTPEKVEEVAKPTVTDGATEGVEVIVPEETEEVTATETPTITDAPVAEEAVTPTETITPPTEEIVSEKEVFSDAINTNKVYILNGETGNILVDGQTVVFETPTKIVEIGNIEDVSGKELATYGLEQQKELAIEVGDDFSVKIDGESYVNNYSNPQAAITELKDGSYSVSLETPDGKKRTFRGQRAEQIAYNYKLKQLQNATDEQIGTIESEADEIIQSNTKVGEPSIERSDKIVVKAPEIITPAQSEAVKEDTTTTQIPTTDGKVNEEGSQGLLTSESEDAAPIPEAPPLDQQVEQQGEAKPVTADEDFAGLEPVETEGATVTVEGKEKEASFPKRVIADKKTSGQTKAKIDSARTYLEQKNIMSIGEATATIREIGAEAAEALVRDPLSEINGGVRGVMTQMLINYYDQNGEYEKSADLIRWAKQRLVDQGQEIQSYSLWNALRVGYTIQDSEIEYEKATGRKLPEYLRDRFEKIGEQVAKYEKRIAELEAIQKDKALDEAVGNIKDSIDRENKKPSTRKKNELSAEKKSRKAALRAKFGGIFNDFTNIPRLLLDKEFIEYNKLILEEAAGDFRNFVRLIVDGLGKKARPYAREFYKAAGGTELPDLEKAFVDDNGALKIPNEIIREIVAAGVTSADDLTEKVKEAIIKDVPDVTDREVKEAITQYGKTVNPSKDELDAEIRKLKRDGRLELGLDDAKEGKGVKRTGLQRDKPTDYQRELQRKINEELKKYPQDQQSVEKKWASALDRTKTHLKNTIADLNKRISDIKEGIAEPLPSKKRGFELDEEAKQLQEERDELKKILAELEPKQEMSDEARVKVALAAAERAITATADKINAQEFEYKKKKEPLNTPELVAARERLKLGKDVLNRMREESGFAEQHRYDLWKKRIQKRISDLQEKIDNKDFSVAPKKVMEINQEILELRVKADKLKFERDVEIEKARINSLTGLQKLKQIALDVINLPKSLMASADLSAPLRQGALLTARHPVMGLAAAKEMMKQAFSQKAQDKWVAALHESEIYPYMKHAKLFLSEPSVDLTAKEEQYISNIAEKIPVWGRVVKGSGRAYNGYLNKLRADVFSQFFYALKQEGVTGAELETQLKSYAKFINNATGRGDLGIGETSALVLNSAFFSPRYVASRFNLLNPVFYAKLEPRTRMEALKTMGTYVGVVSMTLALLSAMGDDDDDFTVELDPRSSDFAKLKWGDTRFDLLAGFQQWVRMFAQIVTGQKKSTTTGEVVTLGEGYKSDTRLDVLRKFFISKAAPAAAAGMNILRGKDMMGEPITPEGELLKLAIPLYVSDMYEVYKEEGIGKSVATTLPAFFGVGVQTYGKDKKQPTTREEVQEEMNRRLEKKAEAEMKKEARDNNPKIQKQKDKKEADEDALYERAKKYGIEYIEK
jgi:hypothetical protein